MKANELMIGDWVKYDKQYFQVDGYVRVSNTLFLKYNGHTAHYEDGCVVAEDTESIPLTEEILKANGFSYDSAKEYFELRSNDEYGYFYIDYGFDITRLRIITDKYRCGFDINMDIAFVHELQHALRLCGLNDLADKFKIQ